VGELGRRPGPRWRRRRRGFESKAPAELPMLTAAIVTTFGLEAEQLLGEALLAGVEAAGVGDEEEQPLGSRWAAKRDFGVRMGAAKLFSPK